MECPPHAIYLAVIRYLFIIMRMLIMAAMFVIMVAVVAVREECVTLSLYPLESMGYGWRYFCSATVPSYIPPHSEFN